MGRGTITAYALLSLEPRGTLFVTFGMEVDNYYWIIILTTIFHSSESIMLFIFSNSDLGGPQPLCELPAHIMKFTNVLSLAVGLPNFEICPIQILITLIACKFFALMIQWVPWWLVFYSSLSRRLFIGLLLQYFLHVL